MKSLGWPQLILGLWVLISPWAIGFSEVNIALWSNVIAGLLIAIFALWGLYGGKPSGVSGRNPQMPS